MNTLTRDEIRAKYSSDPNWPIQSFDAQDWAKAFKDKWGDASPDEATMLAWFAGALMRGYDEQAAAIARLTEERDRLREAMAVARLWSSQVAVRPDVPKGIKHAAGDMVNRIDAALGKEG